VVANKRLGSLSVLELSHAATILLKKVQSVAFHQDVADLNAKRPVERRSALRTLNPFIDHNDLVRVGGRLVNSDIAFTSKCPIVLASKSRVIQLIFEYEHLRLLHIGPQGLLANIHLRYWPIRSRLIARQTVKRCIVCFRSSPTLVTPFMAPLPQERVSNLLPITICQNRRRFLWTNLDSKWNSSSSQYQVLCRRVCLFCHTRYPFGIGQWSYNRGLSGLPHAFHVSPWPL